MNELKKLLIDHILKDPNFVSGIFSGINRASDENEWKKITLKRVLVKDEHVYQFNYYDDLKSITKNYSRIEAEKELASLADLGFKSIYVRQENSGIQIQTTKKGKILVKKHKNLEPLQTDLSHDNKKPRFIQSNETNSDYLSVLGLSDGKGNIKPSMQGKFKQINEFVKLLDTINDWKEYTHDIYVVDCGSGNAYLTFATYHYFKNILKKPTFVTGIDIDPTSIENNKKKASTLGWQDMEFEVSNIIGFMPLKPPTLTLALHACDTATDEALMKGITWNSSFILSVPCCHHDLQERLKKTDADNIFAGLFKNGILRERFGDVLTDSFRALILEIMGYKTDVIQYVSTDHTAKNLMIRAKKISDKPLGHSVQNYIDLKNTWRVTPILEEILAETSDFRQRISQP